MLDKLGEQAFGQAFPARLFDSLPNALHLRSGRQNLENAVEIDAIGPYIQRAHRGVIRHSFTVRAHGLRRRLRRRAVGQVDMMSGDDDAGREPLNVPLPGRRQGFVEIVDVEEDVALRRRETAEIHQVSVAAGLYAKSGRRGQCQIGRHEPRLRRDKTRKAIGPCARSGLGSAPRFGLRWTRAEARSDRADRWATSNRHAQLAGSRRAAPCLRRVARLRTCMLQRRRRRPLPVRVSRSTCACAPLLSRIVRRLRRDA